MCICKQKSKKPAGSPGNFNYVFVCTKNNGTQTEIKITAGNDNEAKALAELECNDENVKNTISSIISDEFDGSLKMLLKTDYSSIVSIKVSFWGIGKWFEIPISTIQSIEKIGYGICEGVQYPMINVKIKDNFEDFKNDLIGIKSNQDGFESSIESNSFETLDVSAQLLPPAKELSGVIWVSRFPGSKSVEDLISPFKENAKNFIKALNEAGAVVDINATFRPIERAYLMRTSYNIARGLIKPENAGSLTGVAIEWIHPTLVTSINAAKAMVSAYGIVFQPAFPTKHSDKTAIDMNISWANTIKIKKADGSFVEIPAPTDGKYNNIPKLQEVAKSYSVIKLSSDYPHWSDDGH